MTLQPDDIRLLLELGALLITMGGAWYELKALRKDVQRLEQKQEESNKVKMRTAVIETINQLHEKRIATLEERVLNLMAHSDQK